MTDAHTALHTAMGEHTITSPDDFLRRYGVDPRTLTAEDALTLLHERDRLVRGYLLALETLRHRLERGLVVLAERPTLTAERRWFRLAERSIRLIAKMSHADRQAGADFLASDLGRWYFDLRWPIPSPALLARWAAETEKEVAAA